MIKTTIPLLLLMNPFLGFAAPAELVVAADAYISEAQPEKNYGAENAIVSLNSDGNH